MAHDCVNVLSPASQSNTNVCQSSGNLLFQLLLPIKTNLLEQLTSYKALMIFKNDAPNSYVPAFLQFFGQCSFNNKPSKSAQHNASPEHSLYLLFSNTLFDYWWQLYQDVIPILNHIILKLFHVFLKFTVVICCLYAVFARFKTNIDSKFFCFLATTAKK